MPEVARRQLRISLRGSRNYLHGTDLFTAMLQATEETFGTTNLINIHARFPRFFFRPLELELSDQENNLNPEWACMAGTKKVFGRLVEATRPQPLSRIPFDEESIFRQVRVSGDQAYLAQVPELSTIEHIVFLCKALHLGQMPPSKDEAWIFSRIELRENFSPVRLRQDGMRIRLMARLDGFFTRSEISAGGVHLGEIFFYKVGREQLEPGRGPR